MVQMETLKYGNDELQALDLYLPENSNGKAIILIHGGGWWQGNKAKEPRTAGKFTEQGYTVAALNYRLALDGQNGFPTQNQDVEDAYKWLLANQAAFTTDNTAFVGGSTGGNLAAHMGIHTGRPFVSMSGLLDLEGFYNSHPDVTPEQRIIKADVPSAQIDQDGSDDAYYKWIIENLLPDHSPEALKRATILNDVTDHSGPGLLANSMKEIVPPYEHQRLAWILREQGIPAETILLPGVRHAEAYIDDIWPNIFNFLNRYIPNGGH